MIAETTPIVMVQAAVAATAVVVHVLVPVTVVTGETMTAAAAIVSEIENGTVKMETGIAIEVTVIAIAIVIGSAVTRSVVIVVKRIVIMSDEEIVTVIETGTGTENVIEIEATATETGIETGGAVSASATKDSGTSHIVKIIVLMVVIAGIKTVENVWQ